MKKWIGIAAAFIGSLALSGCSSTGDIAVSGQIRMSVSGLNDPQAPEDGEWRGEYVYFGDMKWRLLSGKAADGRMVLFLDEMPEEYEQELRRPFLSQSAGGGEVTWENSDMREYLNGDFLQMAFSTEEQQLMSIQSSYGWDDRLYPLSFNYMGGDWKDMGFGESKEGLGYQEAWWACEGNKPVRIEADGSYILSDSGDVYSEEIQRLEGAAIFRPCCEIDKTVSPISGMLPFRFLWRYRRSFPPLSRRQSLPGSGALLYLPQRSM